MKTERLATETTMTIARTYAATPQALWDAFTDPDLLRRWYAPVTGWVVHEATVDLRVGGAYLLTFGAPGAEPIVERGTYVAVEPFARLVWEMDLTMTSGAVEKTRTTVTFTPDGAETHVSVVEEGYSNAEITAMHLRGWTTMFEQLGALSA